MAETRLPPRLSGHQESNQFKQVPNGVGKKDLKCKGGGASCLQEQFWGEHTPPRLQQRLPARLIFSMFAVRGTAFCLSHSIQFQGHLSATAPTQRLAQGWSGAWRQQTQKRDFAHSRKPDPHSSR